ncbi:hypothetical protein HBZS_105090 [Helicobacter bizzozeronii CCUG 35545]|nr:hypothetical protein HBZS_105090 [Helicobacter bizzozeronii CCUG 35545]
MPCYWQALKRAFEMGIGFLVWSVCIVGNLSWGSKNKDSF